MNYSFNLIDEPWIPCLRSDGKPAELGIRDTFLQAHELREIRGDTPLETAVLHRLLLAILHRVFGPKRPSDWKQLWQHRPIDGAKLDAYLGNPQISRRFDLFGSEHRFYQALDPRVGEKSVISLVIHTASGNNATLLEHSTEETGLALTPAQAARALLVSQSFGIGGLSGLPDKFTDAPCAKGILFLARGDNLFETLVLNLVKYDEDEPFPTPNQNDCPAWEMDDPFLPNRAQPKGYLDYLTWHNRRVWLFPEEEDGKVVIRRMSWAPGLVLKMEGADPMKHYSLSQQSGAQPLCFLAERALWRDSSVLFEMSGANKPPLFVQWLAKLAQPPHSILDTTRRYQLMALGMAKSKASLEFLRAEAFPLHPSFLIDPDQVGTLSQALQSAENAAKALQRATFLLALLALHPVTKGDSIDTFDKLDGRMAKGKNPKSQDRDAQHAHKLYQSWGVERCLWSDLEPHFHRLIQDLPDQPEDAVSAWRQEVRRTAKSAFDLAISYAGSDLRAQRAAALARQQFNIGLAAALGKASTPDNSDGGDKE